MQPSLRNSLVTITYKNAHLFRTQVHTNITAIDYQLDTIELAICLNLPNLTHFRCIRQGVKSFIHLKVCTKLEVIRCPGNQLTDIDPVCDLLHLKKLDVPFNLIRSIEAVASLQHLTSLDIEGNYVHDLSPLRGCPWLDTINCTNNPIAKTFSVLGELPMLEYVDCRCCGLTTLANLKPCSKLYSVQCDGNMIPTCSGLEGKSRLTEFYAFSTGMLDVSGLADLPSLELLQLSNNKIASVLPLASCLNLQTVDLNSNCIKSIDPLFQLKKLTRLYSACNKISNINNLDRCSSLRVIDCSNNRIRSVPIFGPQLIRCIL